MALGACAVVNLPTGYGPLFSPEWQARLKTVPERAMVATVEVFRIVGQPVYDPDTDTWTENKVVDYTGKARVQPLRSTRWITPEGNDAPVQTILFSIPIDSGATLYIGSQASVLVSPLNADLLRYQYVVGEIMDSSNPLERTFLCTVNQETI